MRQFKNGLYQPKKKCKLSWNFATIMDISYTTLVIWLHPFIYCSTKTNSKKITDKEGSYIWSLCTALIAKPVLALPNFLKTFKIAREASNTNAEGVLTQ